MSTMENKALIDQRNAGLTMKLQRAFMEKQTLLGEIQKLKDALRKVAKEHQAGINTALSDKLSQDLGAIEFRSASTSPSPLVDGTRQNPDYTRELQALLDESVRSATRTCLWVFRCQITKNLAKAFNVWLRNTSRTTQNMNLSVSAVKPLNHYSPLGRTNSFQSHDDSIASIYSSSKYRNSPAATRSLPSAVRLLRSQVSSPEIDRNMSLESSESGPVQELLNSSILSATDSLHDEKRTSLLSAAKTIIARDALETRRSLSPSYMRPTVSSSPVDNAVRTARQRVREHNQKTRSQSADATRSPTKTSTRRPSNPPREQHSYMSSTKVLPKPKPSSPRSPRHETPSQIHTAPGKSTAKAKSISEHPGEVGRGRPRSRNVTNNKRHVSPKKASPIRKQHSISPEAANRSSSASKSTHEAVEKLTAAGFKPGYDANILETRTRSRHNSSSFEESLDSNRLPNRQRKHSVDTKLSQPLNTQPNPQTSEPQKPSSSDQNKTNRNRTSRAPKLSPSSVTQGSNFASTVSPMRDIYHKPPSRKQASKKETDQAAVKATSNAETNSNAPSLGQDSPAGGENSLSAMDLYSEGEDTFEGNNPVYTVPVAVGVAQPTAATSSNRTRHSKGQRSRMKGGDGEDGGPETVDSHSHSYDGDDYHRGYGTDGEGSKNSHPSSAHSYHQSNRSIYDIMKEEYQRRREKMYSASKLPAQFLYDDALNGFSEHYVSPYSQGALKGTRGSEKRKSSLSTKKKRGNSSDVEPKRRSDSHYHYPASQERPNRRSDSHYRYPASQERPSRQREKLPNQNFRNGDGYQSRALTERNDHKHDLPLEQATYSSSYSQEYENSKRRPKEDISRGIRRIEDNEEYPYQPANFRHAERMRLAEKLQADSGGYYKSTDELGQSSAGRPYQHQLDTSQYHQNSMRHSTENVIPSQRSKTPDSFYLQPTLRHSVGHYQRPNKASSDPGRSAGAPSKRPSGPRQKRMSKAQYQLIYGELEDVSVRKPWHGVLRR